MTGRRALRGPGGTAGRPRSPELPERVTALAGALQGEPREVAGPPSFAGRTTVEVLEALAALGQVHRFGGRPLPGDVLPSPEDLVDQVIAHIAANPRQGVTVGPAEAREVLEERYLVVDPWPFGAVTLG